MRRRRSRLETKGSYYSDHAQGASVRFSGGGFTCISKHQVIFNYHKVLFANRQLMKRFIFLI